MRLGLPALAAGLLALRFLAELPSVGWLLGMAAAGLLLLFGRLYWLGLFLLGFAWACGSAQVALDGRLAAELDGRTLWLEGVRSICRRAARASRASGWRRSALRGACFFPSVCA